MQDSLQSRQRFLRMKTRCDHILNRILSLNRGLSRRRKFPESNKQTSTSEWWTPDVGCDDVRRGQWYGRERSVLGIQRRRPTCPPPPPPHQHYRGP